MRTRGTALPALFALALAGCSMSVGDDSSSPTTTRADGEAAPPLAFVDESTTTTSPAPDDIVIEVEEAEAPTPSYVEVTGTGIAGLNLRAGPGTDTAVLAQVPVGTVAATTGARSGGGDWVQVTVNDTTGWFHAAYLQPAAARAEPTTTAPAPTTDLPAATTQAPPAGTALVIANVPAGANIRSGPGTSYTVVGGAPLGARVTATGEVATATDGTTWVGISDGTVTGWVVNSSLAATA